MASHDHGASRVLSGAGTGGEFGGHVGEQRGAAHPHGASFNGACDSPAGKVLKTGHLREGPPIGSGGVRHRPCGHRRGHRVFTEAFHRSGGAHRRGGVHATGHLESHDRHASLSKGAGLVEDHSGDGLGCLEYLTTLDDDAELGAAAGTHHDRRGGGQAKGTRAGNDEDRHCRGERLGRRVAKRQPHRQRAHGNDHHHGHEHPGDAVSQPGHGRPRSLGLLHQPDDLGEGRVGPHPGGLHHEEALGVHGGADDLVTRANLHGHRFTRHHGGVHGTVSLHHDPIGGDAFPGSDLEAVPDGKVLSGNLGAVHQAGGARPEAGKGPYGVTGALLGPGLEPASQQDEGDDDRCGLEVDVGHTRAGGGHARHARHVVAGTVGVGSTEGDERHHRPSPRCQRADGDEGVHGDGAVTEVHCGGTVEPGATPQHHGCRQCAGQPLPASEHQWRHHRHRHHRHGERDCHRQAQSQCPPGAGLRFCGVGIGGGGHVVAERLDGCGEVADADRSGVEEHRGAVGGEVHVGVVDSLEAGEAPGDAVGARRARHALDGQVHPG